MIPYGRQNIDKSDIKAIERILKSDWLTQGPAIKVFEQNLARYCEVKYAVVVSSGTAALHLACLAAGIAKKDEVITSPITFVASANCVLYCGGIPVFADIQEDSINIDPIEIKNKINKRTKAVIPVHFAGYPCDLEEIRKIAESRNLTVIEDAAHALGAEYKNSKIGSCKYSDMTIFSFHPVKHITTGEGGAITTNNKKLYERLLALRSHGIYKSKAMTKKYGLWYYEMRELGFNYRITDFQCALGISQLKKINYFIKRRREIANIYDKGFAETANIDIQRVAKERKHSHHLYVLRMDFKKAGVSRKTFVDKLERTDIRTQVHYIPIYRQPYYRKIFGSSFNSFPRSEGYYSRAISIPIYPSLRNKDAAYVISAIKKALGAVS